ncbi:MAG: bifunctional 3-deoxy-7-phosphoheptulonate synthase/chorismate mutase type II [Bacteroidetes bacterium]|nr:bifunctional 3-deoxy-7-phosphoheptulonate synthase/chorismate mutase type II [Bacteroidota bacterium]MBU1718824.1 bifunctional 3-deoxy-7-phosphoheptulonate synthase/chorismate mutase type II [Bacteroidota bacterium]
MIARLKIASLSEWTSGNHRPFVIAGPCSAENEEQVLTTAKEIAEIGKISVLRAGLWKPRTNPGSFEGVGAEGFPWLRKAKEQTGLLIAVEVATPDHVKQCLDNGIDVLWIGARTTVSPFAVNDIAKVLKGQNIPVLVKNPLHPDIQLWAGAIERLNKAGITRLAAVHRGFYSYEKTKYRNVPLWEIPIELKRRYPTLPLLTDPSHLCGETELISEVSQRALDMGFDGLMIESHFRPESALSDARQQLTPSALAEMLSGLKVRNIEPAPTAESDMLESLRAIIDETDEQILHALSRRIEVVKEIGALKKERNLTVLQIKRWNNIISSRLESGEKLGIEQKFLMKILAMVHEESIRIQTEIMKGNGAEKKD